MKTLTKNPIIIFCLVIAIFQFSCNSDDEDLSVGFSEDIRNFVPDSTIQQLRDMGMLLHEGKIPPNIEGVYLVSPLIMVNSSVPNDYDIGTAFADKKLRFRNQDIVNLTITADMQQLRTSGKIVLRSYGKGSFLSGKDNSFTIFTIQDGYIYGEGDSLRYVSLEVSSGIITDEGIKNYQEAFLLLNDYGAPHGTFIPVNTGRLFYDFDSLAENSTMDEPVPDEGRKQTETSLPLLMDAEN